MSGTQQAARGTAGFDTGARLRGWLWPALLLASACTAEITGGRDDSTEENTVSLGSAGSGVSVPAATPARAGAGGSKAPTAASAGRSAQASRKPEAGSGNVLAAIGGSSAAADGKGDDAPGAETGGSNSAAVGGKGGTAAVSGGSAEPADAGVAETDASAPPGGGGEITPGSVRWIGRVDDRDPDAVRFSWAGAGLKAVVEGDTIAVRLESQGDAVYYQAVIDGEAGERIRVDEGEHTVTLAEGLSSGEHVLELYRDTEGDGPVSVFLGFEEGTVVGAPPASDRFFEIVGDSISVGYGSIGTERHGSNPGPGCSGDHSRSSWFQTYGAIAARELDAELSTVARSGFGMVRGYGQNMSVMPPLFDDTIAGSNNPRWSFERIPAALIINLGTNDWNGGDPGSSFETAYLSFLAQVREHYPDTLILLTIGPTLEDGRKRQVEARLQQVIETRAAEGDDSVEMIDIGIQSTEVTGCGWHPSAAEHRRVGMVLVEALRDRLGW